MDSRRHDIDWLRVIAIVLLIIYHSALVFQSWGYYIGFIQNEETSSALWVPMALFNIWRIPLLFFVSGMGACFALRRRNWKQLLQDRALRILLPLVAGSFLIVPLHNFIFQAYYDFDITYSPSMGHLWFLANICIYITQIIGFAFLDKDYNYRFFNFFRKLLKRPYTVYLFLIPFILEAELLNPEHFALYVGNGHGFVIGMFAFFFGFQFVAIGNEFWNAINKVKYVSLFFAVTLYFVRLLYFDLNAPHYLSSIESMNWIFAILGIGYQYLNKPGKVLRYLNEAAYPVYILHMVFLYLASYFIVPLNLPLLLKFIIINALTFIGSYAAYETVVKRIDLIRPLFGLKRNSKIVVGLETSTE